MIYGNVVITAYMEDPQENALVFSPNQKMAFVIGNIKHE